MPITPEQAVVDGVREALAMPPYFAATEEVAGVMRIARLAYRAGVDGVEPGEDLQQTLQGRLPLVGVGTALERVSEHARRTLESVMKNAQYVEQVQLAMTEGRQVNG